MFKVQFLSPYGIGDKIATIFVMENCGRQIENTFEICGIEKSNDVIKELFNLFDLQHVYYTDQTDHAINSLEVRGIQSTNEYPEQGYIHYISRIKRELQENYNFNPTDIIPLKLKSTDRIIGNYIAAQFDSRFAKIHDFNLKTKEIKTILKKQVKANEKIEIVGGQETEAYMNEIKNFQWNYNFGNFDHSSKIIIQSNRFVGADSGMSHLAGALGVESHVYFLVPKWYARGGLNRNDGQDIPDELIQEGGDINPSLVEYYQCYPNTICYGRQDFCNKVFI